MSDDDDVHPFFKFEEPLNAVSNVKELCELLQNEKPTVYVGELTPDAQPLHIHKAQSIVPRETVHALNRCLRLMKRHASDNEVIEACGVVMAYLCGECTRGESSIRVSLSRSIEIDVALPDFAVGDVGCRVWGAAHVLSQFLLSTADLAQQNIVEIGSASGLCGLAVAKTQPTKRVYLTDFNQACLLAAKENIGMNGLNNVEVEFLDWTLPLKNSIPWKGSLIIGAAVVYEKIHAELVTDFLHRAFDEGAEAALLALHVEHPGHDRFLDRCKEVFSISVLDRREVVEDAFITTVVILRLSSL